MTLADSHVGLAHGNGGRFMRELIEEVFARELASPRLDTSADAVALPWDAEAGVLVYTTDGFTVQPLEFPGGDIGSLAVHGTTNDLAVAGAVPLYLSLNAFIEEGLEVETLRRIVRSLSSAARAAGVTVACGDTKVLPHGQGGGLYLATTGIGVRPAGLDLAIRNVQPGDRVLVSGTIGAHGIAVMLAREQFGLRGTLCSDAASVLPLTLAIRSVAGLRFMRDPTRGGLATVMHEVARGAGCGIRVVEPAIPIAEEVASVCDMLGYDPCYLACEGRVVAIVAPDCAATVLAAWRALPSGADAAIVGRVVAGDPRVVLETEIGGERYLEELEDDPLPRIC